MAPRARRDLDLRDKTESANVVILTARGAPTV
jgi:hypothetical protein